MAYYKKYGVCRCTSTALSCFLLLDGGVLDRNDPARRGAPCVCRPRDITFFPASRIGFFCCLILPDVRGDGSCRNEIGNEAWDEMLLLPRRHGFRFLPLCLPPSVPAGDACRIGLVASCRAAGSAKGRPAAVPGRCLSCRRSPPDPAFLLAPTPPAVPSVIARFLSATQPQENFYETHPSGQRLHAD